VAPDTSGGQGVLAHVCIGTTCLAPAASPVDLAERLREARHRVG
jgi:hypothetical protein